MACIAPYHNNHDGIFTDVTDKAEITWPNGKVETQTNRAINRFYKVKEGQDVVGSQGPSAATAKHE
jgi:hypothetical protein